MFRLEVTRELMLVNSCHRNSHFRDIHDSNEFEHPDLPTRYPLPYLRLSLLQFDTMQFHKWGCSRNTRCPQTPSAISLGFILLPYVLPAVLTASVPLDCQRL